MSLPPKHFGVARDGVSIREAYAEIAITTGISYRINLPDLVPPYEEYAAMIHANYNTLEWLTLASYEKAQAVAFYRLSKLISLHEQDAVAKATQRKQRRA